MGKFCSQCGEPVNGNEKFCTNCGARIQRNVEENPEKHTEEYTEECTEGYTEGYTTESGNKNLTEPEKFPSGEMPKRKKGKRIAWIIGGVAAAVAVAVFILMQCGVLGLTDAEKIKLVRESTIYMGVTVDDILSMVDEDDVRWEVDGDEVEAEIVSEDLKIKFEVESKNSVELESIEYAGIEISADMLQNFWKLYGSEIFGGSNSWEDDL